jgi:hypothetical protein
MNFKFAAFNLISRNKGYLFIAALAAIIFADLFFQSISIWIFVVLIFFCQIFYCNKYENSFIFIAFTPKIAGAIFISQGVSGIGGFFIPLGMILIWKDIYKERNLLIKGYIWLFLVFILFGFSAFLNVDGDYYASKLLKTFTYGTLTYICFSILFINRELIRFPLLGMIFILWGVFLLRFVIDINNIPGPSNLFHFGFMREQTTIYGQFALITEDDFTISYHLPGFLSLVGLSIFLLVVEKNNKLLKWYVWIMVFIVIFYTGARQNLLAYIVLLMFYIFTLKEYSFIYKYLAIGFVIAVSTFILLSINSVLIQNVLLSSTMSGAIEVSGRSELISRGLELFNSNPLWGIGFGHYSYGGIYTEYPHNIFIELLAEIGIIGFSFIIILCCYVVYKNRQVILFLHNHNFKPYLVLFPLLVRAMISLNMTSNIIVISFIFSLNCLRQMPQEVD